VCAAAWLLALPLIAAAQTQPVEISFTVAMPRPHTHLFEVDVAIQHTTNGLPEERLVIPVWTPGSYLVREFARNVQDFAAANAAGQQLQWEKINKDTWRVVTNGAREWHPDVSRRLFENPFDCSCACA
jgi:predicted metalloprotease with PDZ domain